MKKISFLSICISLFCCFQSKSQFYTLGDISASANISGFHDSTQCMSMANEYYVFVIANSFVGDVLLIKDQFGGWVMDSAINTSGANPWAVTLSPNSIIPFVPDNQISGGMAFFGGSTMKFINGSDTIYNVNSFFGLPVFDPCSYGDVSGKVYIDNNSDCIFNTGDDALSAIDILSNVNVSSGMGGSYYGYTNSVGDYSIEVQESWLNNYTVSIPSYYQFIFPSTACSPTSYTYTTLPQTSANFSLQCTSLIDVQSAATAPISVRPNIPFILNPYVSNTGCDIASGTLTLIKDANTIYNALLSSYPATSVNGDTLQWIYTNLTNVSGGAYWNTFIAGIHLTPNTSVTIGDTLCFNVSSTLLTGDINPTNNQYTICLPVVNSYDPNAKEVSPKGVGATGEIPLSTNQLDYTIHFQNTGTATAYNISIIDTLDANVDASSLKNLGNSHNMTPEWLASNIVKFNFYGIMLPDSNTNEEKSHGQVRYSVKLKSGLAVGTQIKNTANIYFDFNPAIVTNTTVNTLAIPNGISVLQNKLAIQLYPNPADDELTITLSELNNKDVIKVSIYSINSQLVKEITLSQLQTKVDISKLDTGLYFVKISSGKQSDVRKFVKN